MSYVKRWAEGSFLTAKVQPNQAEYSLVKALTLRSKGFPPILCCLPLAGLAHKWPIGAIKGLAASTHNHTLLIECTSNNHCPSSKICRNEKCVAGLLFISNVLTVVINLISNDGLYELIQ